MRDAGAYEETNQCFDKNSVRFYFGEYKTKITPLSKAVTSHVAHRSYTFQNFAVVTDKCDN